jgi:hypothetical protein
MLVAAHASSPVVGVVQSRGDFRIDQAAVSTNGTLFEGSVVETGEARAELVLNRGNSLLLVGKSRARIFGDRMVLEAGGAELNRAGGYWIQGGGLQVTGAARNSRLQVALSEGRQIRVAAIEGEAQVRNGQGILVARLQPGMMMALRPDGGSAANARLKGVVRRTGAAFLLTDEATNVTVELRGVELARYEGARVEVTGTIAGSGTPAAKADHVVQVSGIKALEENRRPGGAPPPGAGRADGFPVRSVVIVGGVSAAAATVGALYATDTIGGKDEPSLSR